jgi:hypothetical protein
MKGFILSLLPLAASAAVLQPRVPQGINPKSPLGPLASILKGLNGTAAAAAVAKALPSNKLAKVTTLPAQLRPGAKRTVASYGPYLLAGRDVRNYNCYLSILVHKYIGTETEKLQQFSRSQRSSLPGHHQRGSLQELYHLSWEDKTHI